MAKGVKTHNLDTVDVMDMRAIVALGDHGTIVEASKHLGVSPGAVAYRLHVAELYFQRPLFHRWARDTRKKLKGMNMSPEQKLTSYGMMVYDLAEIVVSAADELRCLARSYSDAKFLYGGSIYVGNRKIGYSSTLDYKEAVISTGDLLK